MSFILFYYFLKGEKVYVLIIVLIGSPMSGLGIGSYW